jgi:hypothetical protein
MGRLTFCGAVSIHRIKKAGGAEKLKQRAAREGGSMDLA